MARESADPAERARMKFGRRSQDSQPVSEPAQELASDLTSQPTSVPAQEAANELVNQQISMPVSQPAQVVEPLQSGEPTSQQANLPDSQIVSIETGEQSSQLEPEPVSEPAVQPESKRTSKRSGRSTRQGARSEKKEEREQQAIYLSSMERQALKLLVAAEGRDISDIMADAFNLYLSRSKFRTAINAFLSAQETK